MGADFDETKGRIKQAAGHLTGNRRLEREGKAEQVTASVKAKAGKVVDRVKDALHRD